MAKPLNATAASLLGFLLRGPLTGWDLVRVAQQQIGDFWTLTRSQVYRELADMAERGLVTAGDRGPRDRRPFQVTEAGRAAFADWIGEMPGSETIRFPLLLTMSFGEHLPAEQLRAFIRHHREMHAARLGQYELAEAARPAGTPFQAATLAFGLAYERAVLEWFDSLPPEIRDDR